jgi:Family of unknown function (DUF6152)
VHGLESVLRGPLRDTIACGKNKLSRERPHGIPGPPGDPVSRGFDFRLIVIAVVMAALIAVAARPALAHHSFTMFDQSKTVTLHGTVKDFRWTNPHVFIQLLVKGGQRNEEEWSIEMTSPEHLSRAAGGRER